MTSFGSSLSEPEELFGVECVLMDEWGERLDGVESNRACVENLGPRELHPLEDLVWQVVCLVLLE